MNNTVLNNLIGTNNSGMSAIGNGANGVVITDAGANTIGVANGGNVISGNGQNGIAVFGVASIGNQIYANRIGANFQATGPIGNQQDGIRIDSAVTTIIGGADESLRNVIGGNVQHGIGLYDGASGTRIVGNTIGFSAPLTFLGNGLEGIQVNNASNTTIGGPAAEQANLISRNGRNGVSVIAGTHNLIEGNRIFGNTALGIDLGNDGVTANDAGDGDTGPNSLQNFPVLAGVVGGVTGTLNSTPGSGFLIEYYGNAACDASQHGEGETFLGSALVLTDANGNATIPLFPVAAGQVVTATATSGNGDGDTSEFSACVTVPAGTGIGGPDAHDERLVRPRAVRYRLQLHHRCAEPRAGAGHGCHGHRHPSGWPAVPNCVVDTRRVHHRRPGGHVRDRKPRGWRHCESRDCAERSRERNVHQHRGGHRGAARSRAGQQLGFRADDDRAGVVQRRDVHRPDALCRIRRADRRGPPGRHESRRPPRCRRLSRGGPRRHGRMVERRRRALRCAAIRRRWGRPGCTWWRTSTGIRTPT